MDIRDTQDIQNTKEGREFQVIQERKLRKIGNSVAITLSKDFLKSIGANESDTVFVDEALLKQAIVKKEEKSEEQQEFEMMIAKSMKKHDELYEELVTK